MRDTIKMASLSHSFWCIGRLPPPPKDEQWFVVSLDEIVPLDVKGDPPTQGPDFAVRVQVREAWKRVVQPVAAFSGSPVLVRISSGGCTTVTADTGPGSRADLPKARG
jgi:hypothetical protein